MLYLIGTRIKMAYKRSYSVIKPANPATARHREVLKQMEKNEGSNSGGLAARSRPLAGMGRWRQTN